MTKQEDPTNKNNPPERTFLHDHRHNHKLHRLYVAYALETMITLQTALEELDGHSRITSSVFADQIRTTILDNVQSDAAWFEAAALLYAKADVLEYLNLLVIDKVDGHDETT